MRYNFQFSIFNFQKRTQQGFTLVETLVAITLLTIAIVAPMSLTMQSLSSAYYARDQITAFYLAQEAIEGVRAVRDGNILKTVYGTPTDLLENIPVGVNQSFTVDMSEFSSEGIPTLTSCNPTCPALQTNGTFYGYHVGWADTPFTRSVTACFVLADGTCTSDQTDEVKVSATVEWTTGAFQRRTFTLTDNLYRWILDTEGETEVTPGGSCGSAPCVAASPGSGSVTVTVLNDGDAHRNDYLYLTTSPGGEYVAYMYLNGEYDAPLTPVEGPVDLTFYDLDDGSYQVILYSNEDDVKASAQFTVGGGGGGND